MGGEICSLCCGTERENTVNCPFECPYLQEARAHEKPPEIALDQLPNRDVRITQSFLNENDRLLMFTTRTVLDAALEIPGVVDNDVRDALEALTRTYRTLESDLYYETRPANLIAAGIHDRVQQSLAEFRQKTSEQGMTAVRDADVLGVLVFVQHTEMRLNNGRQRGRSFLDFLRGHFAGGPAQPAVIAPA